MVEVRLFRGGQEIRDPATLDLVETRTGQPLSMRQVRESLGHLLISLGEFADVSATADPAGVVLRYDLIPLQAAVDVEVRGSLGRSQQALLDLIARRFGRTVRPDQIPDAVTFLEELYRESGRYAARITPDTGPAGNRLVFVIDQGPAARIRRIDLRGVSVDGGDRALARLGLDEGDDMGEQIVGSDSLQVESRRPGETQEILDDAVEPTHLRSGGVQALSHPPWQGGLQVGQILLQELQLNIDRA